MKHVQDKDIGRHQVYVYMNYKGISRQRIIYYIHIFHSGVQHKSRFSAAKTGPRQELYTGVFAFPVAVVKARIWN